MTRTMSDLLVRDVMIRDPPIVPRRATLRDAARRLWSADAESLLVTGDDGAVLGLVSERELVLGAEAKWQGRSATTGEWVSSQFISARPEERSRRCLTSRLDCFWEGTTLVRRAHGPTPEVSLFRNSSFMPDNPPPGPKCSFRALCGRGGSNPLSLLHSQLAPRT